MEDYPVIIDESAREDIGSVVDWLAEVAPHKIGEWLDNLEETLSSLSRMPERCPLAPENGKWGEECVRQLLFDRYPSKYRVLFTVQKDAVHVVQIRHGARPWMHESSDD